MEPPTLAVPLELPRDDLFAALADAVPGFVWIADPDGQVSFVNENWRQFTGLTNALSLGHGWLSAIHPGDVDLLRMSWQGGEPADREIAVRCRRQDGAYRWHKLLARPVPFSKAHRICCTVDIHDQVMARQQDAAQLRILEMVASGSPIDEILAALCRYAERELPGARCSILLVDAAQGIFTGGVAPSLAPEFTASVRGVSIGTGIGSCGTAAFEQRDVITTDIATDPLWDGLRELELFKDLSACWSRPIFASSGTVLATFGFYLDEKRGPTPDEMERLDGIKHIASLAIERSQLAHALKESEAHYRHSVELNPQIPWTADPQGRILAVSSRWEAFTGIQPRHALGDAWKDAVHPEDIETTEAHWQDRLATGAAVDIEYRIRLQSGLYRWVRARAAARHDLLGHIVSWYGTLEDVHDHHMTEERLRRAAYEDDLTRLPNRRRFEQELQRTLATSPRGGGAVGLLILDMDEFKQVNDRYGHAAGDAVLRLFSNHLRKLIAPTEFAARLGGDEFAVILRSVRGEADVLNRASILAASLDSRLKQSVKARNCTTSVGGAMSEPNETSDELLKKADLALYSAKSGKSNEVRIFTPAIRVENQRKSDEIELAREALTANWILPYYQPKVSFQTGAVVGFEALIRIAHPDKGVLSPDSMLAALEHPRTGAALGDRMMSLILADLKTWQKRGVTLDHVAVNLSTENLSRPDFSDRLLASLRRAGFPTSILQLEITERVLIDELGDHVAKALARLRDAGVRISLDDFGTGYASLTHLQRFPVDELKIDRSFIQGLTTDNGNAAIVRAMIGLGTGLGMSVVAEGVETAAQANLLRSMGCDVAQGFYFGRPMPAEQIVDPGFPTVQIA